MSECIIILVIDNGRVWDGPGVPFSFSGLLFAGTKHYRLIGFGSLVSQDTKVLKFHGTRCTRVHCMDM